MTAACYSGYYGRRPIYLISLPFFVAGSIGVVLSTTVSQLMVFRGIQTFGASPGITVGGGVISDIYRLEERGWAMGIFLACVLIGPAIAPITGGLAAYYADWRIMQLILVAVGIIGIILIATLFPETSQPGARGVDKEDPNNRKRFVFINSFKVLWILRSPNFFLASLGGTACLITDYVLLVPLAETIGVRYNISNEAVLGACFSPLGLGNIIGAPLAGRISDMIIVKWEKRRGSWYPEDRLRATLFGMGILVPISSLLAGIFMEFIPGPLGLTLTLIAMFFNGVGVDFTLSPIQAYCVDVLHSRSAEAMAASMGFRALIIGLVSAGIFPSIHLIGVAWTNAIAAIFAWVGFLALVSGIQYGATMRAAVDVGYSTSATN